jgi:hypothetical protein
MLSARRRREALNVELVQGLTWTNFYYLAGNRDSFSPANSAGYHPRDDQERGAANSPASGQLTGHFDAVRLIS